MLIKKFNEGFRKRYRNLNVSFFSNIDNKEKAYALGLIYSDGSIDNTKYGFSFVSKDIDLVELFKKIIGSEHKICKIDSYDHRTDKVYTRYTLHVCSKEMVSDLEKIGLSNDKSFNCELPRIDSGLFWHFFRGLFDGDGSIYRVGEKDGRLRFKIIGSSIMIEQLKEEFNKYKLSDIKISKTKHFGERGSISSLSYGSYEDLKILRDNIYRDSNGLRLDRKYKIFSTLKKYGVGKYDRRSSLKRVIQYDLNMNQINVFINKFDASEKLKIGEKMIQEVLNGRRKQTHGFIFRYESA